MADPNLRAVETPHGVIYSRNALVVERHELSLTPMTFVLSACLSLANCRPARKGEPDVQVVFTFTDIRHLAIHRLDDYPGERFSRSSFDEYVDEAGQSIGRFVLSTYDHVFDIAGRCEMTTRSDATIQRPSGP